MGPTYDVCLLDHPIRTIDHLLNSLSNDQLMADYHISSDYPLRLVLGPHRPMPSHSGQFDLDRFDGTPFHATCMVHVLRQVFLPSLVVKEETCHSGQVESIILNVFRSLK